MQYIYLKKWYSICHYNLYFMHYSDQYLVFDNFSPLLKASFVVRIVVFFEMCIKFMNMSIYYARR